MRQTVTWGMFIFLAACGSENPSLLNISQPRAEGPDEFAVLTTKPLELPENLAALPQPTPGGPNRTDPTPQADAIEALGGNAAVLTRQATDSGLLAYTNRFGVNPQIRAELAEEDLAFRRENDGRLLERIFNTNVYFDAYEEMELNKGAELERLRRAGVRTPAAPPVQ